MSSKDCLNELEWERLARERYNTRDVRHLQGMFMLCTTHMHIGVHVTQATHTTACTEYSLEDVDLKS